MSSRQLLGLQIWFNPSLQQPMILTHVNRELTSESRVFYVNTYLFLNLWPSIVARTLQLHAQMQRLVLLLHKEFFDEVASGEWRSTPQIQCESQEG